MTVTEAVLLTEYEDVAVAIADTVIPFDGEFVTEDEVDVLIDNVSRLEYEVEDDKVYWTDALTVVFRERVATALMLLAALALYVSDNETEFEVAAERLGSIEVETLNVAPLELVDIAEAECVTVAVTESVDFGLVLTLAVLEVHADNVAVPECEYVMAEVDVTVLVDETVTVMVAELLTDGVDESVGERLCEPLPVAVTLRDCVTEVDALPVTVNELVLHCEGVEDGEFVVVLDDFEDREAVNDLIAERLCDIDTVADEENVPI